MASPGTVAPSPSLPIADRHDLIRVQGARVNNLKDISIEIPKRRMTVFTGVSGSGKSSLVFDTIAAESRRLIDETYSTFVQVFMPNLARPDVDVLEGLTTAILVDQERLGANPRSTLGTVTDANAMLRSLFSRLGTPSIGGPTAFSFNIPTTRASGVMTGPKGEKKIVQDAIYLGGMCAECEGRGTVSDLDLSVIIDESKSLLEGAILVPGYTADGWMVTQFAESGFFDPTKPIKDYTEKERNDLLYRQTTKVKARGINITYDGLIPKIRKSMFSKDVDSLQPHIRAFVERAAVFKTCPVCDGTRLNDAARSSKIDGRSIADVCAMQVTDAAEWLRGIDDNGVAPLVANLLHLFDSFVEIGLGYLSLDRPSGTLSGGEAQRTKMVRHIGSALTDVTYVFDEPTVGLHPHDVQRMNTLLLQLRDKGNTVLVVEHKPETIVIADRVVDLGPGAGTGGGTICFEGDVEGLKASDTLTGRYLDHKAGLKETVRPPTGVARDPRRDRPQPAGCRRRRPARRAVRRDRRRRLGQELAHPRIDPGRRGRGLDRPGRDPWLASQQPGDVHRTARPDPDRVREGQRREAGPVQRQLRGSLPDLQRQRQDLHRAQLHGDRGDDLRGLRRQALPGVGPRAAARRSEHRGGARPVRSPRRTRSSVGVSQTEASTPAAATILQRLVDVGLGYLKLGQPLPTLSGGERQRLKLATRMGEKGGIYVLDEPTTGLHLADVDHLLGLLDRLVDSGKSVIVIAHHQAVMAHADWIIDLGPGAGHDGGRIVFEGTPADLVAARSTLTGEHLAAYVGA